MISFGLTRSAKVVLDVFGPGPGCVLAGKVPLAGKRGLNRFRFDGTVQQIVRETFEDVTIENVEYVPLEPGTYKLELNSRGGKRRLAQTLVTIVDPSSPRKVFPSPDCSADSVELSTFAALASDSGSSSSPDEPLATQGVTPAGSTDSTEESDSDVLGGEVSRQGLGVPIERGAAGDESPTLLEVLLLALALGLVLALLVAALRRRRPLS